MILSLSTKIIARVSEVGRRGRGAWETVKENKSNNRTFCHASKIVVGRRVGGGSVLEFCL